MGIHSVKNNLTHCSLEFFAATERLHYFSVARELGENSKNVSS